MIDVNKITSTLAKLPDQQLQQYAQMHKNDPYIMALAMTESNRRKELRSAGQGAQGMQEQPKVVDQMVAEMAPQQLPEEMGIGRLNAGDMNFAGGGIIAFAGNDESLVRDDRELLPGENPLSIGTAWRKWRESGLPLLNYMGVETTRSRPTAADAAPTASSTAENLRKIEQTNAGYVSPTAPKNAEEAALLQRYSPTAKAAPTVDTTRKGPGAAAPAAGLAGLAAAKETGPTDIDALQKKYFGEIDQEVGGLRNARAGLVAGIKDLAEQNVAATKADIEKRGDVYKGREERLAQQEKGLEGMSDRNMGLALLQAGAAMMSTPGGLGVAAGKSVDVFSKSYAAGLDKIEAAKAKFAEARDRLDDLRINRDDMNAKEIRAAEKEVRESELKGKELLYNGLVSDLGIKQKNVTAIFGAAANALNTDKEIASRQQIAAMQERGANARAAMPSGEMRAAMLLGTGNTPQEKYLSGAKLMQEAAADKSGMAMAKLLAQINADERKNNEPLTTAQGLLSSLNQINALMYPKVGNVAPTRDRP